MTETGNLTKTGEKNSTIEDYDLIFFHTNETGYNDIYQIKLSEKYQGEVKRHTNMGDTYTISYIGIDSNGSPILVDYFDAMLLDPIVYAENCIGSDVQGCILRKTEKSNSFFIEYIQSPEKIIDLVGLEIYKLN